MNLRLSAHHPGLRDLREKGHGFAEICLVKADLKGKQGKQDESPSRMPE